MAKSKAWKRQRHTRQVERRERKQRAMKAQYKPHTVPKSARIQRVVSRAPQRGMPRLVSRALERMIERHKLLTMPKPVEADEQEAA